MGIYYKTQIIFLAIGITVVVCVCITIFAIQTSVISNKKFSNTSFIRFFLVWRDRMWYISFCCSNNCSNFWKCTDDCLLFYADSNFRSSIRRTYRTYLLHGNFDLREFEFLSLLFCCSVFDLRYPDDNRRQTNWTIAGRIHHGRPTTLHGYNANILRYTKNCWW